MSDNTNTNDGLITTTIEKREAPEGASVQRLVRIRVGGLVVRDHRSWTWPKLPDAISADMVFRVQRNDGGWLRLVGPKFGAQGNYGNGAALVFEDDVIDANARAVPAPHTNQPENDA